MATYLSPGVYVEEVPSSIKAIAGVSTSTAAFIGIVPDAVHLVARNPDFNPSDPASTSSKIVDFKVPAAAKTPLLITNWSAVHAHVRRSRRRSDGGGVGQERRRGRSQATSSSRMPYMDSSITAAAAATSPVSPARRTSMPC